MTGTTLSEYIRRRRLSQAVFDIQKGKEKIIDIGLKYCYESPTTFTRAFKELHGISPLKARNESVSLKTYPKLTFLLTIKGGNEMNFRMEHKESFQIMGLSGYTSTDNTWENSLWGKFIDGDEDENGKGTFHQAFVNGCNQSYYTAPFWQVGAYDFSSVDGKTPTIIGAEFRGDKPQIEGITFKTIPKATWAVFRFQGDTGSKVGEAITRIQTEWFPQSGYSRDESVPMIDVYPGGLIDENYTWEIWMPIKG